MSVEKVPVRFVGEPQACTKGNHDNPVSGNLPKRTPRGAWRTKSLRTGKKGPGSPKNPQAPTRHPGYE